VAESNQHYELVRLLMTEYQKLLPKDKWVLIQSDSFSSSSISPKFSGGYRPDVYYEFEDLMIVGEAKTSKDIESSHSLQQYESFLRSCSLFKGRAIFLLAVPFAECVVANNIVKQISKKFQGVYEIKILKGYV